MLEFGVFNVSILVLDVKIVRILTPVSEVFIILHLLFLAENEMEQMQFSAIVLMAFLTLALVFLLPHWESLDPAVNRARRLMAGATGLLTVQFLLQYLLHLRTLGATQAVMFNLLFFIPCSFLLYLTMISLLRRGQIYRHDLLPGIVTWIIVIGMLVTAHFMDGMSWLAGSPEMHWAEIGCSMMYILIQVHFTYLIFREMRRTRRELKDYYDQDRTDMLHWLKHSALILSTIAVTVPAFIYVNGWPLALYGFLLLASIFYLVFSFICYAVSNNSRLVMEAERNAEEAETNKTQELTTTSSEPTRVEEAVARWIANGKHLRNGITAQQAADEMHVPRYQLSAWLKTTEQEQFSSWLTYLRIEEAKRQMVAHPEWSNDVIAERCGFGSRSYFQTVFRKYTGMTPTGYLEQARGKVGN